MHMMHRMLKVGPRLRELHMALVDRNEEWYAVRRLESEQEFSNAIFGRSVPSRDGLECLEATRRALGCALSSAMKQLRSRKISCGY
jgi:hypothetical protein